MGQAIKKEDILWLCKQDEAVLTKLNYMTNRYNATDFRALVKVASALKTNGETDE